MMVVLFPPGLCGEYIPPDKCMVPDFITPTLRAWDAQMQQRQFENEWKRLWRQGAQNTEVDGTPFMATGPCCTGVAGVASAPSETDPV